MTINLKRLGIYIILLHGILLTSLHGNSHNLYQSQIQEKWHKCMEQLDNASLLERGQGYGRRNSLDSALVCFTILSLRYNDNLPQQQREICANAFNDVGVVYYLLRDHARAYQSFEEAIATGIPSVVNAANNNIAGLYYFFGMKTEAVQRLRQVYRYSIDVKDSVQLAITHINLLNYYLTVDSLKLFRTEMQSFVKDARHPIVKRAAMMNAAALRHLNGDTDGAVNTFNEILREGKELRMVTSDSLVVIGCAATSLMQAGKYAEARTLLEMGLKANGGNNNEEALGIYEMMSKCAKATNNKSEWIEWRERYITLRDSLFTPEELSQIKDYSALRVIDEIKSDLDKTKNESQHRKTMIISLSVGLVFAILLAIIIVLLYLRLRRQRDILYQQSQTLLNSPTPIAVASTPEKYDEKVEDVITPEETVEYAAKINAALESSDAWTKPEYSVYDLAKSSGIPVKSLPLAIRAAFNTNFYGLLADRRIREACRRLSDVEKYGNLTIEAVSQGLGYKSRSAFSRLFKEKIGMSPSDYITAARRAKSAQA